MRTNSQTYARIFAVIGTILLIPGIFGLLISLLAFVLFLILLPFFTIGFVLLIGYYKCKNDKLSTKQNIYLWVGTILFNGLLFLLIFGYVFAKIIEKDASYNPDIQILGVLISFGYFVLTSLGIFALTAARAEYRKEKAAFARSAQTFT